MTKQESVEPKQVVTAYFAAMRRGSDAATDLFALFADDATYVEPFSQQGPAVGLDAIAERFRAAWQNPLPDLELDVLAVQVDGEIATSRWECRSPGLPGPVRGEDHYEIRNGRISRLEVTITPPE